MAIAFVVRFPTGFMILNLRHAVQEYLKQLGKTSTLEQIARRWRNPLAKFD
jgi:hypothetical protein